MNVVDRPYCRMTLLVHRCSSLPVIDTNVPARRFRVCDQAVKKSERRLTLFEASHCDRCVVERRVGLEDVLGREIDCRLMKQDGRRVILRKGKTRKSYCRGSAKSHRVWRYWVGNVAGKELHRGHLMNGLNRIPIKITNRIILIGPTVNCITIPGFSYQSCARIEMDFHQSQ